MRSELFEAERVLSAKVKGLITCLINRLQAEAPSEASHTSYRDERTSMATVKKEDFEADDVKHSSKLEAAVDGGISALQSELGVFSESRLKMDITRADERYQECEEPMIQTVQKTFEVPQMHVVEKTVEGSQLRIVEQILEAPEIQMARVVSEDAIVDLGGVAEDLCKDSTLIVHIVTKSGAWAGVKALITDLITRLQAESLSETSGADGQMSSLFQDFVDVVSQTMKGLSGVREEKHMSGILGTSRVDRTFWTERQREHGQRDHVAEEQTKRRARMARQVWVKCGTKRKPLEYTIPPEINPNDFGCFWN